VFRSQHNGGARGKGQAIQSDVRRNHGWRRVLVEVTPPQPFQRRPLGLRPSHGGKQEVTGLGKSCRLLPANSLNHRAKNFIREAFFSFS